MAKKRKDLSGQLDGLFSDFDKDAKAEEEELGESRAAAEILGTEEMEQPQAEVEPVEMPAEVSAVDELFAVEPVAAGEAEVEPAVTELVEPPVAEEVGQPQAEVPAEVSAEVSVEVSAVDELFAVEPVAAGEAEVEPAVTELVEPPVVI